MEHNEQQAQHSDRELKDDAEKIKERPALSADQLYKGYFGQTPKALEDRVLDVVMKARATSIHDTESDEVRSAFARVVKDGEKYLKTVRSYLETIPQELAHAIEAYQVTVGLQELESDHKAIAKWNVVLEGLVSAGVMGAVLVPATILESKFAPKKVMLPSLI